MTDMQKIQKVFEEVYGVSTDISPDGMSLHGKNEFIVVYAEAPRGDNGNRWRARIAPAVIFDDYWQTDFIENDDFDYTHSVDEFCEELRNDEAEVYKRLFVLMGKNYEDLWEEHRELSEDWLRKCDDIDKKDSYIRDLDSED